MCSSSFLPTASPIDLPFKVNSYLSLPFVPHQRAKCSFKKRLGNVEKHNFSAAQTLGFHALMVL